MYPSENPALLENPQYSVLDYTLAAGEEISLAIAAEFVVVLESTAAFKMGFNQGSKARFEAGLRYSARQRFRSIEIENTSAAANTIRIGVGLGDIQDARLVLSGTIGTKPKTPDAPLATKAAVSALDVANTILAAQNLNRKELILVNSGAGTVYINGTVAVLAGQGIPLAAGQTLILENSNAIYARNDTGGAVAVSVTENEYLP